MLKPLQSELLNTIPEIRHGFFTRQGGVSTGLFNSLNCSQRAIEDMSNVVKNCQRISEWFGNNIQLIVPFQIHENDVLIASSFHNLQQLPHCDGLLTQKSCQAVCVTTADCVPILLCDSSHKIVAAVHAGWRGAVKGIVFKAIQQIIHQGGKVDNIVAAIGPSIQQSSYQVSHEVYDAFINECAGYQQFFQTDANGILVHEYAQEQKLEAMCQYAHAQHDSHSSDVFKNDSKYLFDLPGLVYYQLQQAGVMKIDWLKWDTYTNPELFFSCRRNSHQGQQIFGAMLTGIMLEE